MERLTVTGGNATSLVGRGDASRVSIAEAPHPTDTTSVRDVVRDAIDRETPLRIIGRGTWVDAGRPVRDARPIALDGLSGIVDYTPGDLTLTARAGTTLREIAAATAAHGQWLALSPWGGDDGSLGATAATATAGPVSGTLGTPRDIVIGLEAVTGTGDIIRGGGRVVKNVAGFDLTRLMVGAWGTLGVITEVSVRLRALPEREITVVLPSPTATPALTDLLTRLRTAAIAPLALELVSESLATRLDAGNSPAFLIRLAGNEESVASQRDVIARMGDVIETDASIWSRLRASDLAHAAIVRLSSPAGRFADTWASAERLAAAGGGLAHATVLRSVARVVMPHDASGSLPRDVLQALGAPTGHLRIFERLPESQWSTLAPTASDDALSRGIRSAFDPHRLLNPGILGEAVA